MEIKHMMFLLRHYRGPPCRVGSVRSPAPIAEELEEFEPGYLANLRVSGLSVAEVVSSVWVRSFDMEGGGGSGFHRGGG